VQARAQVQVMARVVLEDLRLERWWGILLWYHRRWRRCIGLDERNMKVKPSKQTTNCRGSKRDEVWIGNEEEKKIDQ
jgi:hypothetical protein